MTVIGLHGHAGVGKDTVAGFLALHGFQRVAFADLLREALEHIDPWMVDYHGAPVRLRELLRRYSWEDLKRHDPYRYEIRRLLQNLGTEVGREILGTNVWVDAVVGRMRTNTNYVVTDVRFPNEVEALHIDRFYPTWLVKVTRPGFGPVNKHISDAGLSDDFFDAFIVNDGDLDDLRAEAESLILRTEAESTLLHSRGGLI